MCLRKIRRFWEWCLYSTSSEYTFRSNMNEIGHLLCMICFGPLPVYISITFWEGNGCFRKCFKFIVLRVKFTGCGASSFTGASGTISSPNYPNSYLPNTDCTYTIVLNRVTGVSITFAQSFWLESGWDSLTVGHTQYLQFLSLRCFIVFWTVSSYG